MNKFKKLFNSFKRLFTSKDILFFNLLGYLILYVAVSYYIKSKGYNFEVAIFLTIIIGLIDLSVEVSPRWAAKLFTKRAHIAYGIFIICLLIGLVLAALNESYRPTVPDLISNSRYFFHGMLLGVVTRVLLTALINRTIKGADAHELKFGLMISFAAFLVSIPINAGEQELTSIILVGVGSGFFAHYGIRSREHRRAAKDRSDRHFLGAIDKSKEQLKNFEFEALKLYRESDWIELANKLKQHEEPENTFLINIKVAMERAQGQYEKALITVTQELERPTRDTLHDNPLMLQYALVLGELNQRPKMYEALEKTLDRFSDCILTTVTLALRLAEDIPFSRDEIESKKHADKQSRALDLIWNALQLIEKKPPASLLVSLLGASIPVNGSFLLDSYGYVLLKTGRFFLARTLLHQCIYMDPHFSSPYLHLAELYLVTKSNPDLIQLCAWIAIDLEGSRDSLIKKRARQILQHKDAKES